MILIGIFNKMCSNKNPKECIKKYFLRKDGKINNRNLNEKYIKEHSLQWIITYLDNNIPNDYSLKNNFKLIGRTQPNYWYVKNGYIQGNRLKFQKHKLSKIIDNFDKNLTEKENMMRNGYTILYDCGNFKYQLTLD